LKAEGIILAENYFITNKSEAKLKNRINALIPCSGELKFLVGFFYFSGITQLYEALKENTDVVLKILVGLNVDRLNYELVELGGVKDRDDDMTLLREYLNSVVKALNNDEFDTKEFYEQAEFFVRLILDGRLIIRKTREPNHSKLYLFKAKGEAAVWSSSKYITGSSNLTRAGLSEQGELNVEIGDFGTSEAEEYFDELWLTAVQITEKPEFKNRLLNTIKTKTIYAEPTPYEAYAYILKTYLDLQTGVEIKEHILELLERAGYRKYRYQTDAVTLAVKMLKDYNGVIISDVVGLGKSIIAGMVARHLDTKGVIICPPGLIGGVDDKGNYTGWKKYTHDFELEGWAVESSGKLEKIFNMVQKHSSFDTVIIDEAHRFRNQDTADYQTLSNICRGKKVILLTATPFNNTPADIFSLLKLFSIPGKSSLSLDGNLEGEFRRYNYNFKRLSNIRKNYSSPDRKKRAEAKRDYEILFGEGSIDIENVKERTAQLASSMRHRISAVTIRRNRIDLTQDPTYSKEVIALSKVQDPREVFFELTPEQSDFYDRAINEYFGQDGSFTGAIYRPFIYEKGLNLSEDDLDEETNREILAQANLYDFMRRLLVKRFESSFGAFCSTIQTFRNVHEQVLTFISNTDGKYILNRKLLLKLNQEQDEDEINKALAEYGKWLGSTVNPRNERIYEVDSFIDKELFLSHIKADLALFDNILKELRELKLVENDPKVQQLAELLEQVIAMRGSPEEPKRKVVVFSEYIDTVSHIENYLNSHPVFKDKVLSVKGYLPQAHNVKVLSNFDVGYQDQDDNYDVLLSSDKMSEGFNLNRAGAVINYDIPWNPTRVIQRVGRINRISRKVFDELYIYNFFPTVKGSTIVKSREIASQKMFLIHNTLGEDAKIFDAEEEPTASALYSRLQKNPDELESESFLTTIKRKYQEIDEDTRNKIKSFPPRLKVAKEFGKKELLVFFKRGGSIFVREKPENAKAKETTFAEALPRVECQQQEPRLELSDSFWLDYQEVKDIKSSAVVARSEISLEKKAIANLQTIRNSKNEAFKPYFHFVNDLLEDAIDYKTLSDFTMRRLANLKHNDVLQTVKEIENLKQELGENYLEDVKKRARLVGREVIIAVENQAEEVL
jgi:superfamily II DNA or RNA helicase/HKD family nuclease